MSAGPRAAIAQRQVQFALKDFEHAIDAGLTKGFRSVSREGALRDEGSDAAERGNIGLAARNLRNSRRALEVDWRIVRRL
jgi:hypothetical protein